MSSNIDINQKNTNYKLIRILEPFVELDIKRIQKYLVMENIYNQYEKSVRNILSNKNEYERTEEIIKMISEMKTTMYLLSSAYLEYTRYKDPDFMRSIPKISCDDNECIKIDMLGDITGRNWYDAETHGRWSGPLQDSSIFIPCFSTGKYKIEIEVVGELIPGCGKFFNLSINDKNIVLKQSNHDIPYILYGDFTIDNEEYPFLVLNFHYSEKMKSPSELPELYDNSSDIRKL